MVDSVLVQLLEDRHRTYGGTPAIYKLWHLEIMSNKNRDQHCGGDTMYRKSLYQIEAQSALVLGLGLGVRR